MKALLTGTSSRQCHAKLQKLALTDWNQCLAQAHLSISVPFGLKIVTSTVQTALYSWAHVPKGGASRAVAVHLTLWVVSSAVINQAKCAFSKQRGRAVCPTVLVNEWMVNGGATANGKTRLSAASSISRLIRQMCYVLPDTYLKFKS